MKYDASMPGIDRDDAPAVARDDSAIGGRCVADHDARQFHLIEKRRDLRSGRVFGPGRPAAEPERSLGIDQAPLRRCPRISCASRRNGTSSAGGSLPSAFAASKRRRRSLQLHHRDVEVFLKVEERKSRAACRQGACDSASRRRTSARTRSFTSSIDFGAGRDGLRPACMNSVPATIGGDVLARAATCHRRRWGPSPRDIRGTRADAPPSTRFARLRVNGGRWRRRPSTASAPAARTASTRLRGVLRTCRSRRSRRSRGVTSRKSPIRFMTS